MNAIRCPNVGSAALISGHVRIGALTTKSGVDIHGRAIQRACCEVGSHPGAGDDARMSEVTRSGCVAA